MEALNISFMILAICGIWKPIKWNSNYREKLFKIWRFLFAPQPYLLASVQLARMILVDMSIEELTEIMFIFLSILNVCCKSISIFTRREELLDLINRLDDDFATPKDVKEEDIQYQYRHFIRFVTMSSVILVETTAFTFLLPPFFQTQNNRSLPFKIWLPYDYSSELVFWITYVPESITIITVSLISVSSNTLIFGFLTEACAQLELLSHRFTVLPLHLENVSKNNEKIELYKTERQLMIQNIRHHEFIFKFTEHLKKTFSSAIMGQYVISSLVISASVFQLSTNKTIDVVFCTNLLYLMCMLVEFFLYCWFSNELSLKSEDLGKNIFRTNWIKLSSESFKDILITMLRSSKPITVTCGYFVVLSLDTFMKVIKLSYSAFSLLRTSLDE